MKPPQINRYRNPWHKDLNQPKPEFYENAAPCILEHRGVKVFRLFRHGFDFVLKGVCITQRAGATDARSVIDSILDCRAPVSDQVRRYFPNFMSYDDLKGSSHE